MPTLIGDGGHARDIIATIGPKTFKASWFHYRHHSEWEPTNVGEVVIGVNNPKTRARIAADLEIIDLAWHHGWGFVGPDCLWGPGTHINYGVTMTRTSIGHHCTIAPGVTICGDVTIGDRVFIGVGAIIVNLTHVPDDTFIRAGTVWTQR